MTELTPLERELLTSVTALQIGFETSMESYKRSLKQAVQQQSEGLENWQKEIEKRLTAYEQRQQHIGETLKGLQVNFKNLLENMSSNESVAEKSVASLRESVENLIEALTR